MSHNNIGNIHRIPGRRWHRLSRRQGARDPAEAGDANPSVTRFQGELAWTHSAIGLLLPDLSEPAAALASYGKVWRFSRSWPTPTPASPGSRMTWRSATLTAASCCGRPGRVQRPRALSQASRFSRSWWTGIPASPDSDASWRPSTTALATCCEIPASRRRRCVARKGAGDSAEASGRQP